MDKYKVTLTFTEPLLGTVSLNPELYEDMIAARAPGGVDTSDELATISAQETTEKGTTGFHRLPDGTPIIYDYVLKGFLKDACRNLRRQPDTLSAKLTAFVKIIDGQVFVTPRYIPIKVSTEDNWFDPLCDRETGVNVRPLRAQTPQGERVAISRSEFVAPGSSITFTVAVLAVVTEKVLREWFEYGELRGLGQWRNASYGRFSCVLEKLGEPGEIKV